jgi:hypothetical protein
MHDAVKHVQQAEPACVGCWLLQRLTVARATYPPSTAAGGF